jgi:hypothetical protein
MFNKPSNWTLEDWKCSRARNLLKKIPTHGLQWVSADKMTDGEKEQHPEYKTTGGYLIEFDESKRSQNWWNHLPDLDKDTIKSLPNFDADIFKEITGIDVNGNLNFEKFYDIIYIQ